MAYLLRMSAEIHDWLTNLRATDPTTARLAAEALTALTGEDGGLGPPLVSSLADAAPQADLPGALDQSYQHRLERLQRVRRAVADVAALARDVQLQIAELESLRASLGAGAAGRACGAESRSSPAATRPDGAAAGSAG